MNAAQVQHPDAAAPGKIRRNAQHCLKRPGHPLPAKENRHA